MLRNEVLLPLLLILSCYAIILLFIRLFKRNLLNFFYEIINTNTKKKLIRVRGSGPGSEDVSGRLFVPSVSLLTEHKRYKWVLFSVATFELLICICVSTATLLFCPSFPDECNFHVFFWTSNIGHFVFIVSFILEVIQRVNYVCLIIIIFNKYASLLQILHGIQIQYSIVHIYTLYIYIQYLPLYIYDICLVCLFTNTVY